MDFGENWPRISEILETTISSLASGAKPIPRPRSTTQQTRLRGSAERLQSHGEPSSGARLSPDIERGPMRDRPLSYLLLVPAFLIVLATTLYPLAYSFVIAFREWDLTKQNRPGTFVGLDNFTYAFTEPGFLNSLWVTTIFVVTSVVLTLFIAMSLALLLRRTGRMHTFTRIILILPFAMSPALIGVSYRFMFNPEFGVIAKGLGAIFLLFRAFRGWRAPTSLWLF